ncbi:hypothetical protein LAZ67_21001395 [Cordylochernes scorpioides]|uniref:Apple domain-containing protein n=1 Tax=Cordylochernes scorpioides TaxID=51811 RepID=A0ABY6LM31_9ARAC|nr:hypothetical protein LAZ67_21001395 [Cordylochernes scorpioides]
MLYASRTVTGAESPFRCERECDLEARFTCRSVTFLEAEAVCLLSSESRASVPAPALRFHPRALYSQKNCREPRPPGLTTHAGLSTGSTTTPGFTRPPSPAAFCSFERTVGVELRFVPRERLPSRSPVGVVGACHRECLRVGSECRAFLVQYGKFQSCFWLRDAALENKEALIPANDFAYFEKVCYRERPCPKLWAFERVPGHVLQMRATREFPHVPTRVDCEELCLRERCRSAVYLYRPRICRLYSGATRRSHPSSFQRVPDHVDYLENQCVPGGCFCDDPCSPTSL